jgi:hypothetical protein
VVDITTLLALGRQEMLVDLVVVVALVHSLAVRLHHLVKETPVEQVEPIVVVLLEQVVVVVQAR